MMFNVTLYQVKQSFTQYKTTCRLVQYVTCQMLRQTCPPHNTKPPWMLHFSRPLHLTVRLWDVWIAVVGVGAGLKTLKTSIWSLSWRWRKFLLESFLLRPELVGKLSPHRQPAPGWVLSRRTGYFFGLLSLLGQQEFAVSSFSLPLFSCYARVAANILPSNTREAFTAVFNSFKIMFSIYSPG